MASIFQEIQIPNQKHQFPNSTTPFPAVLAPKPSRSSSLADFTSAVESEKPYLESLLQKTGAILFRGFPLSTASQFDQFVEAFGYSDHPYVGGLASRTHIVGRVYTSNESPPDQKIPFHHEMSQAAKFPTKVFFFCEVEPGSGGETPIVLSHLIYDKMKDKYPELVMKLEEEGLLFIRVMADEDDPSIALGRGWKSTFSTHDTIVAEERAASLGMKLEWINGDGDSSLVRRVIGPVPAFKHDDSRGRNIWFNGMAASYTAFGDKRNDDPTKTVTFGNGDPLPSDGVHDCLKIMEEESVAIPWERGDVLVLDNLAVLHARRSFAPPRRVLAALCK
ncbi:Clavaminate synthase-like protein At3g21360 [Linum perenne]